MTASSHTALHLYRRAQAIDTRPAGTLCELAPGEAPGVVIARFRAAGVRGLRVDVHGRRRYLVRTDQTTDDQPLDYERRREPDGSDSPLLIALAGVAVVTLAIAVLIGLSS